MGFFHFPEGNISYVCQTIGAFGPWAWAGAGTAFTFFMTVLGSSMVFLMGGKIEARMQRVCFGFAGGVMAAASVFSLLIPAIEQLDKTGERATFEVTLGFLLGALALLALDAALERLENGRTQDADARARTLMLTAVTLHNIPEGMAVGLAFAAAAQTGSAELAAAAALALGVGIQNFPEGAAVSLPVRQSGAGRGKSFLIGALSGSVEPVFGMLVVFIAASAQEIMPFLMSAAAGAMMLVVFTEMTPEAAKERVGVLAIIVGYALMMALDIGLS